MTQFLFKFIVKNLIDKLYSIYYHSVIQLPKRAIIIIYRAYICPFFLRYRYNKLVKYKNCHKNQRVFIVASGPSLTLEDINLLKGEISFSMNSIFKLFDKTDWRPTYYGIIDSSVFKKLKDEINFQELNCAFFPDKYISWNQMNANPVPVMGNFCLNSQQRAVIPANWRKVKFGSDMTKLFYEGTSVVHFILQISIYMGFTEIYLIGADCNYHGSNKHSSIVDYSGGNVMVNSAESIYNGLIQDYSIAKEVADQRGVKIYNATRGGMLEVFERVELENIIK
jgi:hypothetical protein